MPNEKKTEEAANAAATEESKVTNEKTNDEAAAASQEEKPTRVARATAEPEQGPQVGDTVWYYLRTSPVPEWRKAEVIDEITGAVIGEPFDTTGESDAVLHLKVSLDRRRHHSSSNVGYRLNVPQGTEPGQWSKDKPKDADEAYETALRRYEAREEVTRELARTPK